MLESQLASCESELPALRAGRQSVAFEDKQPFEVLDVACGNLRFEQFLEEALPKLPLRFHAVDNCPGLQDLGIASPLRFTECDLVETLLTGQLPFERGAYGLVACFGFFHHVPTQALRSKLLNTLLAAARPNGLVAVSLWGFLDDQGLAGRAAATTERARTELEDGEALVASLEPGDCFLGWQDSSALRYCHSFSSDEVDELVAELPPNVKLLARYRADGRTRQMNTYLVLERLP
jgi:SAM-dependent methyltransferase